jgi:protein AaeX
MSFVEIDLFGVLIPPLVPLIVLAFAITMALRWLAVECGWTRQVWHPALFEFSTFLIILSATVLIVSDLRIFG